MLTVEQRLLKHLISQNDITLRLIDYVHSKINGPEMRLDDLTTDAKVLHSGLSQMEKELMYGI